jgi:hypothetical protein
MSHVAVRLEPAGVATPGPPVTSDERGQSHSAGGREANWLWLAPEIGHARALVIGEITASHQRGLASRFDHIDRLPLGYVEHVIAPSDPSAPCGGRPMHGDGSLDCVLSLDLVTRWSGSGRSPFRDPRFAAGLFGIRSLLRPGGCFFLSGRNARWFGALLRRGQSSLHLSAARAALRAAGFSETRAYFADQFSVVPACRRAVRAYERWPAPNSTMRAWWAAGGVVELLYRDAFVLAIK